MSATPNAKRGDRIRTLGALFLGGHHLAPASEGTVILRLHGLNGQPLWRVRIGGEQYTLAASEFEVIR